MSLAGTFGGVLFGILIEYFVAHRAINNGLYTLMTCSVIFVTISE